jgi:hypothetical protein
VSYLLPENAIVCQSIDVVAAVGVDDNILVAEF